MSRLIAALLLGILAGLWEVGISGFLPPFLSALKPVIPVMVLFIVASNRVRALTFVLTAAAILDAYTGFTFDFSFIRYALLVFVLDLVLSQFLTNRSVYATAMLAVMARLLDWITLWLFSWIGFGLNKSPYVWQLASNWPLTLLWDMGLTALTFLLIARFTRRFLVNVEASPRL